MHTILRRAASLTAALGFALGATGSAHAAGFQFAPMRLHLTARDRVGSITLTNADDTPLRLEVQAYHWTQRIDGQSTLDPSDALLVFPQMLTIEPHSQRNLRVVSTDPLSATEVTYRVSITEIRAFSAPATRGAGIAIAMQANLPIFIQPVVERRVATIAATNVRARMLTFDVLNGGTVHFVAKSVRVTGIGKDTRPVFSRGLDGGDILADGKREYRAELPRTECGALRAITIEMMADDQKLTQTLDVPSGACSP